VSLTFLNVLFLAGVAAGAIPIIIHLLSRRRLRRIEFSDLRFLAPLNQQRMRSLNLRRLLLLLLRVLIVVLTAVALARPSVRGSLSRLLPSRAQSSVLLLVDTSYSMRAEDERGTALDRAKEIGGRILDALENGDQANLMTFDAAPRSEFLGAVHDVALVRERLAALQPGHAGTDWAAAIAAGLAALAAAAEPNRELYVLSDFAGGVLDSLRTDLSSMQGDVQVTFVPVGVEPFVNVSIDEVHLPPGAVLLEDPVRLGVTVRNRTPDAPADCHLQLELGGQAKGEASLRLGGGALATQEFTVVATQPDAVAGTVRKRIDRLAEDDVRYFVLPVLAQLHVLHVHGAVSPAEPGGAFYLSRALSPSRAGRSPLALSEVEAARFSSRDLAAAEVVVLGSEALLGPSQQQILADWVSDGGGLLLFTGQRATADAVNRGLLERMGGARLRGIVQSETGYVNLVDLRPSGILAGFAERELRTLESVKFRHYAELAASGEIRTMLRYSGGQPAMLEGTHGEGRYVVAAFDAGLEASDLAVSPMFLPLVHRSVVYLAGETGRQRLQAFVGEQIEMQVPIAAPGRQASGDPEARFAQAGAGDGGAVPAGPGREARGTDLRFTVTTPDGRREALLARTVGRMALVAYEDTRLPGHYTFDGAGRRLVRAVNVDTRESDLRAMNLEDLARALHLEVRGRIESPDQVAAALREARHGKELYKLVVMLVLALLAVELWLSRGGEAPERASG
jgi:hypothetical protein